MAAEGHDVPQLAFAGPTADRLGRYMEQGGSLRGSQVPTQTTGVLALRRVGLMLKRLLTDNRTPCHKPRPINVQAAPCHSPIRVIVTRLATTCTALVQRHS